MKLVSEPRVVNQDETKTHTKTKSQEVMLCTVYTAVNEYELDGAVLVPAIQNVAKKCHKKCPELSE
jgi:hypothetical protein